MDASVPPTVALTYTIAGCSEHSGRYVADNIRIDSPQDQSSRWSGAHQTSEVQQWILLRLDSLAILKNITFGKFYKRHPCNMKEFKVYIGSSEDNLTEVLHAALKDDTAAETFNLRTTNHLGVVAPSRFVKIEPLSAHGQHFHTSVWYVALNGIKDDCYVERAYNEYEEERVVLRHILKHLRRRRFLQPYQSILSRSGLQLEHPLVTSLHKALVLQGDFDVAESLLPSLNSASLFCDSLLASQPYASWTRSMAVDADGDTPIARGGHSMCIDTQNSVVYMFGGWDGQRNLDDFWSYDIKKDQWKLIQLATARQRNGPDPRSCHKMVFDSSSGAIYLLGKLEDTDSTENTRTNTPEASSPLAGGGAQTTAQVTPESLRASAHIAEFYRYHTRGPDAGKWDLVTPDTTAVGGPPLLFDHQMVIDTAAQVIYVSGGRVIDGDSDPAKYSGLYCYDIREKKWSLFHSPDPSTHPNIPSRYGHSMVLDPQTQTLFIFGGQRDEQYLSDMYAIHIPTHAVTELFANFTISGGPDACFTQRAVIDPELREIYVFCGLTRHRPASPHTILESDSPYWVYRYDRPERPGKWSKILPHEAPSSVPDIAPSVSPPSSSSMSEPSRPVPRYAHQVVYDPTTKTIYMHGGNSSLDSEVLMDTRETEGSARDRDRDRDRNDDGGPPPLIIRREHRKRPSAPETQSDSPASHLADFWQMRLVRPTPEDVLRRCKYLIRQQKFRELCNNGPQIKALTYLQTEVSSVVNHSDPEETSIFRSLLSVLLVPPPIHVPKNETRLMPTQSGSALEQGSPMKITPDEREAEEVEQGFRLDKDEEMEEISCVSKHEEDASAGGLPNAVMRPAVNMEEDPIERELNDGKPPSADLYKERTAVFEQLMTFVNEDAKQPDKDLLKLISIDQGDF